MKNEKDNFCPSCQTNEAVIQKLLLIEDVLSSETHRNHLRVDQLKSEYIGKEPTEQFIKGFYCKNCDCGFIPNTYLKSNS